MQLEMHRDHFVVPPVSWDPARGNEVNLRANPQIMDLTCFYATLDTSSPLDMTFGALPLGDISARELTTHTCGLIRAPFHKANGLACNPSIFNNQTCF